MSGYVPGLECTAWRKYCVRRHLPMLGKAVVKIGDSVLSSDSVLTAERLGEIDIISLASKLGVDTDECAKYLKVAVGDKISAGTLLGKASHFFGFVNSEVVSPIEGTIEFFNQANGNIGIRRPPTPVNVNAYTPGTVVEIEEGKSVTIESAGALIQGVVGVGGESNGELVCLDDSASRTIESSEVLDTWSGKVVVGGRNWSVAALKKAQTIGVAGVVTGSIRFSELREYIGCEPNITATGDEKINTILVITEGFGTLDLSSRVLSLAKKLSGSVACISGRTQVRAGAVRPELFIPHERINLAAEIGNLTKFDGQLRVGSKVRIIRVPYFGVVAEVTNLPHDPQKIQSGAVVRIAEVKDSSGSLITVPRANLELI